MDQGELILTHGIEQDQTAANDHYAKLSPQDRGELALFITGRKPMSEAPEWVERAILFFAVLSFMETGLRWSKTQEPS